MPWVAWADEGSFERPSRLSDFEYVPARGSSAKAGVVKFDANGQLRSVSDPERSTKHEGHAVSELFVQATQNRFGILLPCLHDIGLHKIYCRADGGHDDSFSWVAHALLNDGTRLETESLCELIADSQLFSVDMRLKLSWENDHRSDITVIHDALDIDLCSLMWSQWLFGNGIGAREYSFFGAYTVDLAASTIEEDPDPLPVVRHIMISQS